MALESPPAKQASGRASVRAAATGDPPAPSLGLRLADAALILAFLALTFLLGAFPLKDTDFWWHLKTGDLIRQTGKVPLVDEYTFTAAGKPWIDLHWLFQVAISWVYALGGVPALTLAKCAVTSVAVFLLITARRREWPIWAMLIAWLPALLVLGGRMYVRPETLTLLYIAAFLAVLVRIDRRPALAFFLPLVQVAWVNSQGLFVFGPILLGFALVDAALRPGAFAPERRGWWRVVGIATVLTGLACPVNPYRITGALYPLQLAGTMGNPIFSRYIAELTPIPLFIERDGFVSLPLQLQLFTMVIGALSFLAPIVWLVMIRMRPIAASETAAATAVANEKPKKKRGKAAMRSSRVPDAPAPAPAPLWRLSLFRLLLFAGFSVLSWQATRNSHQFAAVVGTVTAWNIGEWAGAIRRRAWLRDATSALRERAGVLPRLAAGAAIGLVFLWVASGKFYVAAGEGRTIGLDEQPLWFPHEAVKFAGGPGMPERFLAYHIGHPSLYEYYFGPERKVYADARLEVIGAKLFERYNELQKEIVADDGDWRRELDEMGRPVVLVDLEGNANVGATLLASRDWRCVWLDPIAAVFVHVSSSEVVRQHEVDFAARHFHPEAAVEPRGTEAFLASSKGLRNLASAISRHGPDRVRPLALLGMDHTRRVIHADPDRGDGWKLLGQFELFRDALGGGPIPRFRMAFDPVFDLPSIRTTYALQRSLVAAPDDFLPLMLLTESYRGRGMNEAALACLDRLVQLKPINGKQIKAQRDYEPLRDALRAELGPAPPEKWHNLSELNEIVNRLLNAGRARTAAEYVERAVPAESRSWDVTDRVATLWLHLGEPDRARKLWQSTPDGPHKAVREARVAVTHLAESAFDAARQSYRAALDSDPKLFEAQYGLALLEQDAGRADDALTAARKAVALAPNQEASRAARDIVATVTPYAASAIAESEK
jgi:tetratricopeptide (TPR) repeat protein